MSEKVGAEFLEGANQRLQELEAALDRKLDEFEKFQTAHDEPGMKRVFEEYQNLLTETGTFLPGQELDSLEAALTQEAQVLTMRHVLDQVRGRITNK